MDGNEYILFIFIYRQYRIGHDVFMKKYLPVINSSVGSMLVLEFCTSIAPNQLA